MVVFTTSQTTRFLLPLILGILFALGLLGWRQARDLSSAKESRHWAELREEVHELASDLRVLRAVWNQDASMARSAARILMQQRHAITRIELVYRGRGNPKMSTLFDVQKKDAAILQEWKGELPSMATLHRRPGSNQVLGIQPVRTMEEVLGNPGESGDKSSGRAALIYQVDESRLGLGSRISIWSAWGPVLGVALMLILSLLVSSRTFLRRDRLDRTRSRRELCAAQLEIQVLEESFEHRVDEATREIRESMQRLESLADLKDGFLASVSHELRTPLTSIRSFAEILLQSWYEEDPDTRAEFLTIIQEESKRICRLINQVLDLEKIEAGKMDWRIESFDMVELGRKTLKVQTGLQKLKPVQYELVAPEGAVLCCGDRDRLQQVLVNLLSNAWKHSPEGGRIHLVIQEFAGGVELRIEDEGPGIPDDGTREAIFDKFHQDKVAEEGVLPSTGLGLPIAGEIVHMHGGWISYAEGNLSGACFAILLPHDESRLERALAADSTAAHPLFRVPANER